MSIPRSLRLALSSLLLLGMFARPAAAGMVDAIEYYNAALDHYFVTANTDEIGKLDTGVFVGWQRTQQVFKVLEPNDTSPGASPVCRFYGSPAAGLDSHFYSASPQECAEVQQKFPTAWLLESSNVFQAYLPNASTGACPAGTRAVYRTWNNRADSNHRYTTDPAIQDQMIAKGYIPEGYGLVSARLVALCAPVPAGALPPACTVSATNTSPQAGAGILLAATCTNNPTSFSWSGCTSSGSTCGATSENAGSVTYTVVASNAAGAGVPASIQVTWSAAPPPPPPEARPACNLIVTSAEQSPVVNSLVTLQASCNGDPTGYQWTGCASTTNVCQVRYSFAGFQSYSVAGVNSGGVGIPATANVNWVASQSPPIGLCGQYPATLYSDFGSAGGLTYSNLSEAGFRWNAVWTVRFTVPASASAGSFGSLQVAEYGGPATYREATVSTTACDFRAVDPSGISGPVATGNGNSTIIPFLIGASTPNYPGLQPGGTYFLNVRNYLTSAGTITCDAAQVRCDALVNINLPR